MNVGSIIVKDLIEECFRSMEEKHIARIPASDKKGHCMGIVVHGGDYASC